jgi:hypothetical protein
MGTDDDFLEQDDSDDEDQEVSIQGYDLTAVPNDFNVSTIVNYIDRGVFKIPAFQRHYVWDIRRASKLIESIILGIPIPQIFVFEQEKNQFLVVDGQQRLMSIYYFVKKRFPRLDRRVGLRRLFDQEGRIPESALADDTLFENFNLQLPPRVPQDETRLNKLNYDTLGEDKTTFELRTIRNIFIKQVSPTDDDSAVHEIFHRLNSGGVNLTPQEIRASLYHSAFYDAIHRINGDPRWRRVVGRDEPDLRMKDIEVLLRGFAMLVEGPNYAPSMSRFLNRFSKNMKKKSAGEVERLERLFSAFLQVCEPLPTGTFGTRSKKLNMSVFEAVFAAAASKAYRQGGAAAPQIAPLNAAGIDLLKKDAEFATAASTKSSHTANVQARLRRAREILLQSHDSE